MKKFQLKNVTDDEIVGTYDTKVDAIEAMNEVIDETNETNDETEEEGLSPFDFKLEVVEVDDASAINTFDEARKYLNGFPNADFVISKKVMSGNCLKLEDVAAFVQDINPHHLKALVALNKLFTIAEAWNKADGFVPDFADRGQWKYFPWFKYDDEVAGFVYAYTGDAASTAAAAIGSLLCFISESRAKEFGEKYADLYNDVFLLND
jgi:hypothetical protein|nr:MAG TPA: hypothetical protein [Caudoviricetes sp.]